MNRKIGIRALLTVIALVAMMGTAQASDAPTVNLNTATLQVMQLPGVGPKRAEEIVRRRLIRPFRRTSDLLRIKGIGRRTYLKLRPLVSVTPPPPPSPVASATP